MIHVTGTLTCATEADADIVRRQLPTHIALSRTEAGCLTFNVTPTEDPRVWRLVETFTDRAAFEAHQDRTRASDWFRATAHLARDFQVQDLVDPQGKVTE